MSSSTAAGLNQAAGSSLRPREWGRALEALKHDHGLSPNYHGKITEYGHYLDHKTGDVIGNLLD